MNKEQRELILEVFLNELTHNYPDYQNLGSTQRAILLEAMRYHFRHCEFRKKDDGDSYVFAVSLTIPGTAKTIRLEKALLKISVDSR